MSTTLKEPEYSLLKQQVKQINDQGKVFSNKDVYTWIKWNYRKGRFWTDKYILPNLKWRTLETRGYPSRVIGKYLPLDDLKSNLRTMLNDYSV